jgi:polysaccharide export outer membrane protein
VIKRREFTFASLALAAGVAGCSQKGADLQALPKVVESDYRLGAADEIQLNVFGEERLRGDFKVSDTGFLALPLIGTVKALGLTMRQTEVAIADELKKQGLFTNPNVTVQIKKYRPFFITGEVSRPGEFDFRPNMTVLVAVSVAGGFTPRALQDYVSIQRLVNGVPTEGRGELTSLVQPGDVIFVYERKF